MPKIMYRPNPTPPPFVPPVPPVPTVPYVTMSPFPFDTGTPVTCKICNVVVPDGAISMALVIYNDYGHAIDVTEWIESPIVGDFNISAVAMENSSNNFNANITFYDLEGELASEQLVVYQP